ncbi:unnamed protein product [Lampetra fluviatilis]
MHSLRQRDKGEALQCLAHGTAGRRASARGYCDQHFHTGQTCRKRCPYPRFSPPQANAEAAAPRTAHAARVAPHAAAALGKRCECFQTIARGDSSTIVIRRVATASSRNCVNAALLEAIPSSRPLLALFEEVPLKAFAMEHAAGALLEPKFQALG